MKKIYLGLLLSCFMFSQLFAVAQDNIDVKVLAKTSMRWDKVELLNYPNGQPEITILRITIPPKTELDMHTHPVINAGVLLSGELTVITEKKEKLYLKEGEAIIEVVDKWHYGKNEGDVPAEIVVFYAGVKDEPITIKEK